VCVGTLAQGGGITVFSADGGSIEQYVPPPHLVDNLITNICFGGPDMRDAEKGSAMAVSRRSLQRIRRVASLMIGATIALTLAACSSGGNGGATGASTTPAGQSSPASAAAAGQAAAAKARYTKLIGAPTLGLSVPLKTKPPAGKQVYWLAGNVESIENITTAVKAATTALGWDYHSISYTYGDPQSTSGAIEQAVAAHADYIVISGSSIAASSFGTSAEAPLTGDATGGRLFAQPAPAT
jgi:hypothetical protein